MTIKEQWRLTKEEFGENAFSRFEIDIDNIGEYKGLDFNPIELHPTLRLKPLAELFAHDDSFYIDAYRMWEWQIDDCEHPLINNCNYYPLESNGMFKVHIKAGNDVRRKTSAALPFDLVRAKNGDVVEYCECGRGGFAWVTSLFSLEKLHGREVFRVRFLSDFGLRDTLSTSDLRMKYPPRKQNS